MVVNTTLVVTMIDASSARAAMPAPTEAEATGPESVAVALARLREESRRWARRERACLTTGVGAFDELLAGGWPLGAVTELVGRASTGRTALATATAAAATARGEVVVWVDVADAFDPPSMAAAGVCLDRVLWVRPRDGEAAVRATELTLEAGGFTVAVVDLGNASVPAVLWRQAPLTLRLVRAAERTRAVVLALTERPWVGSHAAVTLHLGQAAPRWRGGAVRWLDGLAVCPEEILGSNGTPSLGPRTAGPGSRPPAAPRLAVGLPGGRP
jgi:recombination protein RecA